MALAISNGFYINSRNSSIIYKTFCSKDLKILLLVDFFVSFVVAILYLGKTNLCSVLLFFIDLF